MENVGDKVFDANKKLDEIRRLLKEYDSVDVDRTKGYLNVLKGISIKIVGALTEVMKVDDYKLSNRACEFVDKISKEYDIIWSFAGETENAG